jgi:diaminopimelate epimerase
VINYNEKIDIFKGHGIGNDYVVLDCPNIEELIDEFDKLNILKHFVQTVCDRNFGVGSDGILVPVSSKKVGFGVRIFNPDGSEAEKSGNGIRIFSHFLINTGKVSNSDTFSLETLGGIVEVKEYKKNSNQNSSLRRTLAVDMGRANFSGKLIPFNLSSEDVINFPLIVGDNSYFITAVNIGNPHCVVFLDQISPELAKTTGGLIENHPSFPERTNVQFAKVISRSSINIEIWERGAGYTLGSGSSSCAVAAAAFKLGLTDSEITINMAGGSLNIKVHDDFSLVMTGEVVEVFRGSFTLDMINLTK